MESDDDTIHGSLDDTPDMDQECVGDVVERAVISPDEMGKVVLRRRILELEQKVDDLELQKNTWKHAFDNSMKENKELKLCIRGMQMVKYED